ncbi:hypothetical protein MVEN_00655200 [Mycena venus]|uniref:Uncharacterized protein n=1 Tax=Mycena venus TaxID=2733690 RepID=A0A8H6YR54_9AGAR|nr:hypothetical protein MVEN_00655200 [Mycena venus]
MLFGTTDVYSTQLGESLHRLVKRLYALTNKRDHEAQIAKRVMRLARARLTARLADDKLRKKLKASSAGPVPDKTKRRMRHSHIPAHEDPFGIGVLELHHCMSNERRKPLDIFKEFGATQTDPAKNNFLPKLKEHILGRFLGREFDGDTHEEFTADQINSVRIVNNRIYSSKILRVNYTTYDVRRDQDVLNPDAQSFVMVRSPETEAGAHPYWYAQILGVFNATVHRVDPLSGLGTRKEIMEFLWVRWLGVEPGYRSGIRRARLPKVGFVPETDPYAFGFLDPAQVIRGSHLIPVFQGGRTNDLLATEEITAARRLWETEDWANYYVDMYVRYYFTWIVHTYPVPVSFADRDIFMRYLGGGIGHLDVESVPDAEAPPDGENDEEIDNTGGTRETELADSDSEEEWDDADSDSTSSESEDEGAPFAGGEEEELALSDDEEMDIDRDGYAAF